MSQIVFIFFAKHSGSLPLHRRRLAASYYDIRNLRVPVISTTIFRKVPTFDYVPFCSPIAFSTVKFLTTLNADINVKTLYAAQAGIC